MTRSNLSRRRFLQGAGAATLAAVASPAFDLGRVAADNVDIELLTFIGTEALERESKWFADYGAQHGMNVTETAVSGSGFVLYVDKLKTSLVGGKPPDAARMWTGYLASPYVSYMTPLDDYYAEYGWDNLLVPAAVEKTIIDGKKYGLPISFNGMPFWYRKDAFEKAGITEPPTTYAALEDAAERLKQAGYVPLAEGGKFGWDIMRVWEYLLEMHAGAQLHDDLIYMRTSWENQAVVDAFATWKKWVDNLWVNEGFLGMAPDDADAMLTAGTAAMLLTGPWEENNIRAANLPADGFGLFVGPTDQPSVRFSSFAEQWQIPNAGKNQDKVAELLNAYIQPDTQKALLASSPATVGALDTTNAPLGGQVFDLLNSHETFLVLDQAMPQEITNAFFAEQASVSSGSTSPEDAAKAMQKAIDDYKATA
jgi:raffinose/stachyose/melibiose transport system substrate-binding protein